MNKHQICPACNSNFHISLKGYEKHALAKCQKCHLVFALNIPNEEELKLHYEGYSRSDYHSPITISRYRELLDDFNSFKENGNILDVGCGIGYFLDQAKQSNWSAYGTEFTEDAVKICETKGIKMYLGSIENIDFGDLKFDVITSFEVIEHLNNPQAHVDKLSSLLRKGGLLYLTTPNFDSMNRRMLKDKWNVISYPEHLCYYNSKSLDKLFTEHGLHKRSMKTEGISPGRLLNSRKNQNMDFTSSETKDENLRESIERSSFLKFAKKTANIGLSAMNLGETLKACYIKS